MRHMIPLALAAALATPAAAQEAAEDPGGFGLIQEGAGQILRGLADEAAPVIDDLSGIGADLLPTFRAIALEMGPAFVAVFSQVDAIANYEPPAFLPNGDIVLRRRDDAPAWTPPEAEVEPAPEVSP